MAENEEENVTGDKDKEGKSKLKKEKSKDSIKNPSESKDSEVQGSPKKDAGTDPIEESGGYPTLLFKFKTFSANLR